MSFYCKHGHGMVGANCEACLRDRIASLSDIAMQAQAQITMAVARLGGTVDGAPTHTGNFLQRIDELRKIEVALRDECLNHSEVCKCRGCVLVFASEPTPSPAVPREATGSSSCPVCGMTAPHTHTEDEIRQHRHSGPEYGHLGMFCEHCEGDITEALAEAYDAGRDSVTAPEAGPNGECPTCRGYGIVNGPPPEYQQPCPACKGTGRVT